MGCKRPSMITCRSEAGRVSNDYFSGSFHSDADSSGISSSELSDVALTELMVSLTLAVSVCCFLLIWHSAALPCIGKLATLNNEAQCGSWIGLEWKDTIWFSQVKIGARVLWWHFCLVTTRTSGLKKPAAVPLSNLDFFTNPCNCRLTSSLRLTAQLYWFFVFRFYSLMSFFVVAWKTALCRRYCT